MNQNAADLRVAVDIVGCALVAVDDRHRAVGGDDVLHEERRFGHHRAPTGLVPADRSVIEHHLELAVIVHVLGDLVGQPQAHAVNADGLRASVIWHMTST